MKKIISVFSVVFCLVLLVSFSPGEPPNEPDIRISVQQKGGKFIKDKRSNNYGKVGFKKTVLKIETDSISYFRDARIHFDTRP